MTAQPGPVRTVTPEGVELDLEYATVGSRGIAYLLDVVIVGCLLALVGVAEATFGVSGFVPGWLGLALLLLFAFMLQFGYPIAFETLWRGRTPGKAAMGLRVVTTEGAPVGLRHAAVRAVVGLLELWPTAGIPAMVTSILTARGQRLGDLAAGTVVLRVQRASRAPVAHEFRPPPGLEAYTARLDVTRLGTHDYGTVRDTLVRLEELAPHARREVAEAVANRLLDRVGPPPPPDVPADVWLACVAAAVHLRRRSSAGGAPAPRAVGERPTATPAFVDRANQPTADAPTPPSDAPSPPAPSPFAPPD
ncbi:RDD family protein [Egicoccus sp. AB-alg6-2]|uniref:RDD family protein n=1 Tax=Egicoccus sp. AB-alg6-2 TaxID=3242692 RepID=UPI00359DF2CA